MIPGVAHNESTDSDAFDCHDAPGFFLTSSDWSYGDYTWHTNRDTYDKINFDDVKRNATLVAMFAYQASEDPSKVSRTRRVPPTDPRTGQPMRVPVCQRTAAKLGRGAASLRGRRPPRFVNHERAGRRQGDGARGRERVNVEPTPNRLSTVSSPPMPRASSRLIASPSPVPSVGRVRRRSTCTNGSKIVSSWSGGDPDAGVAHAQPNGARVARAHSIAIAPPASVNLIALDSRLRRICCSFSGSALHGERRRRSRASRSAAPSRRSCGRPVASATTAARSRSTRTSMS